MNRLNRFLDWALGHDIEFEIKSEAGCIEFEIKSEAGCDEKWDGKLIRYVITSNKKVMRYRITFHVDGFHFHGFGHSIDDAFLDGIEKNERLMAQFSDIKALLQ